MWQEPFHTAFLFVVVPLAAATGVVSALLVPNWAAVPIGGVGSAVLAFSIHTGAKYWPFRDQRS